MEDDNTVWSVNKVIQYDPITLEVLRENPTSLPVRKTISGIEHELKVEWALREQELRSLKYFSLKSEYRKVVGQPSQKMTVDELIMGILDKERI